jgi:large subunit ribosomal protein L6
MSRIGTKPVVIPQGVTVKVKGCTVSATGPKGSASTELPSGIEVRVANNAVEVIRPDDSSNSKSMHGLGRSLVANMIIGVSSGYSKHLELEGVGFRADVQDRVLMLTIGFSSPKEYKIPDGIEIAVKGSTITVSGTDKQQVGHAAARIKSFYPPEPYKGKGIRYKGEHIRRKAGKTVA